MAIEVRPRTIAEYGVKNITLLKYPVFVTCSFLMALSPFTQAQDVDFEQSNCTIIYSLQGAANQYFNEEIEQLNQSIVRQSVLFIDLNHWQKPLPHLKVSGRTRNQLRQKFQLPKAINQTVVINGQGDLISRYSGSITLVNALLDCQN
jgi:hypothetical protein